MLSQTRKGSNNPKSGCMETQHRPSKGYLIEQWKHHKMMVSLRLIPSHKITCRCFQASQPCQLISIGMHVLMLNECCCKTEAGCRHEWRRHGHLLVHAWLVTSLLSHLPAQVCEQNSMGWRRQRGCLRGPLWSARASPSAWSTMEAWCWRCPAFTPTRPPSMCPPTPPGSGAACLRSLAEAAGWCARSHCIFSWSC